MKYIKVLSAALLIAGASQVFAADALADPAAFATKLISAGVTNADLITNDTLAAQGYKKSLALPKIRAAFVAGARTAGLDGRLTRTAAATPPPAVLDLAAVADQHGSSRLDHAGIVAGLAAKTHAVVQLADHHLDAHILTGLRTGTHVVVDDAANQAAIAAETAAKQQAQLDRTALDAQLTALKAAAAASYKAIPLGDPARAVLRAAYVGMDDAAAAVIVGAVAGLNGGNIAAMDDQAVPVAIAPVPTAAQFLAAINGEAPIAGLDIANTLDALHAAHDGTNQAEVDALQALAEKFVDLM